MRHVLLLDAGPVSQRKGRAFWSKSVEFLDAPVFPAISGPRFVKALREWTQAQPVRRVTIAGRSRPVGIERKAGMLMRVRRDDPQPGEDAPAGFLFRLDVSTNRLRPETPLHLETMYARTLVVASGFEDVWSDIEVDRAAQRLYQSHRVLLRYAGNRKGWHVCIRCDGHLHVDEHLAVVGTGPFAYSVARGAQDFTNRVTILTNGRPPDLTKRQLATLREQRIDIVEDRIAAHIGKGTDLLGLRLEDGRELYFDGYFLDEGLTPNTDYLHPDDGWNPQRDDEGLLVVDEDGQVLDAQNEPIPGLFAGGDIVANGRNLIATALALGQNAGLSASDLLRTW
jgi:thioredoxin reductase